MIASNLKVYYPVFYLQTNNSIHEMEKTAALIRKAICMKEGPMKLAQTRLEERTRRINVELCNDPVMQG